MQFDEKFRRCLNCLIRTVMAIPSGFATKLQIEEREPDVNFLVYAPFFWRLLEKQYGYCDKTPTLQKFFVTMIVTYTDTTTGGDIPRAWKTFLSPKTNDAVVFVKTLMNNAETAPFYDDSAEMVMECALDVKDKNGNTSCEKSEEFLNECVTNKTGKNKGKRGIWFNGNRTDKKTGIKKEYCKNSLRNTLLRTSQNSTNRG